MRCAGFWSTMFVANCVSLLRPSDCVCREGGGVSEEALLRIKFSLI